MEPLYLDDLKVGDCWKSRARTITETDIVNFSCLTGDFDPLHVDHEYAEKSPFGKPVAHGLLGLSFLAGLSSNAPAVHTVAFVSIREWSFHQPIFVGDTVHVVTEVVELSSKSKRRGPVIWKRQLVKQSGEAVQSGMFETIVANKIAHKHRPHIRPAKSPATSSVRSTES
jgi:acyl dehydratase